MERTEREDRDANRDPLTGEPGSHPVGTGLGAAAGGMAAGAAAASPSVVLVGMRGVVFIQPREDVFHIESSFQVINIGLQAWVPDGEKIALPAGARRK